jgi:hypothetical protein
MEHESPALRSLLDRAAIQDVLAVYFQGLDRAEPELLRRCFTPDVVASYDGRSSLRPSAPEPVRGVEALIDSLVTFKRKRSGEWKVTTHFMGNLNFLVLQEGLAETETYAIAFIVLPGAPDQVAMRSLRYLDRWRRTPEGWRISERQHTLDWSCQLASDFTVAMAQRQLARRAGDDPMQRQTP